MLCSVLCLWCVVVCCVVSHSWLVGVAADNNGVLSPTILTGSTFYIPDYNHTSNDADGRVIFLVTNQTNGVLLNAPELQVVANTTVYFTLSAVWNTVLGDSMSFGLTRSAAVNALNHPQDADPLGLTPTPASLAAGSCTTISAASPVTSNYNTNCWGLNWTVVNQAQVFSATPCVVQWQVPPYNASVNATKYYYFEPYSPSSARRINIVDASASPTTPPSPSGSGSGTGTGTGSGNNNSTTTTSPPTTPGTSSLSPTSSSSSSSTGSKVPSSGLPSVRVSVWAALVAVLSAAAAASASC